MATLRVLLADGDSSFRTSAQLALTRQGYFVIPAATTEDALTHLDKDPVDVVVSEVALKPHDGLELLQAARSRSPAPPVILITEPRTIAVAASGVRQGAFDYLLKPIDDFTRLAVMIDRVGGRPLPPAPPPGDKTAEAEAGELAGSRFLTAATEIQSISQLLGVYAAEMAELAHAPQVLVLLSRDNGQLELAASHGYVDPGEANRDFVEKGYEEFAWQAMQAHEPIWRNRVVRAGARSLDVQGMLGLPLRYVDQALGVTVLPILGSRDAMSASTFEALRRLTRQASLIAQLGRAGDLAARLNPIDRATGLLTRAHFFELADREFRRSWRFGETIGAIQVEIDDFNKLELLLGKSNLDPVIQQSAHILRSRVRSIDLVGRLDTDKIGILVLKGTRESTVAVAERLRLALAELEVPTTEGTWQVTASFGISTYPREQCASIHDLFALAAQAARIAKRAGRNRVASV